MARVPRPSRLTGDTELGRGVRAGVVAYLLWGLGTIFWKAVSRFDPIELIAWRIVFAAVLMAIVVTVRRRWQAIATALGAPNGVRRTATAAALLVGNWLAYMWAVVNDRVIETALGYFIAPIGTMMIGIVVLGERPSRLQKIGIVAAVVAVIELTAAYGEIPVAAIIIATTWSLYGLAKRRIALGGVDGFAAESWFLIGPAVVAIALGSGEGTVLHEGVSGVAAVSFSGVLTAVPLVLFAIAAVRVPFTILGPLNYLVPTINFLLGWLAYGEPLPASRLVGFVIVWIALALITVDRLRPAPRPAATTIAAS